MFIKIHKYTLILKIMSKPFGTKNSYRKINQAVKTIPFRVTHQEYLQVMQASYKFHAETGLKACPSKAIRHAVKLYLEKSCVDQ